MVNCNLEIKVVLIYLGFVKFKNASLLHTGGLVATGVAPCTWRLVSLRLMSEKHFRFFKGGFDRARLQSAHSVSRNL